MLDLAMSLARPPGLAVEFGVAEGRTLQRIASRLDRVHGFDSFEGLPEAWRAGSSRGAFAHRPPDVPNAELHVGLFSQTLPGFLGDNPEAFSFVHMDADLFSSTDTVLQLAQDRFVIGTVILFDEYFNYPGWEDHEHKASCEFIERTGFEFRYVAYNQIGEQVLVMLVS